MSTSMSFLGPRHLWSMLMPSSIRLLTACRILRGQQHLELRSCPTRKIDEGGDVVLTAERCVAKAAEIERNKTENAQLSIDEPDASEASHTCQFLSLLCCQHFLECRLRG